MDSPCPPSARAQVKQCRGGWGDKVSEQVDLVWNFLFLPPRQKKTKQNKKDELSFRIVFLPKETAHSIFEVKPERPK